MKTAKRKAPEPAKKAAAAKEEESSEEESSEVNSQLLFKSYSSSACLSYSKKTFLSLLVPDICILEEQESRDEDPSEMNTHSRQSSVKIFRLILNSE